MSQVVLFLVLVAVILIMGRIRWANQTDQWHFDRWRRCGNCQGQLIRIDDDAQVRPHLGHRLGSTPYLTFTEYVRVIAGVL